MVKCTAAIFVNSINEILTGRECLLDSRILLDKIAEGKRLFLTFFLPLLTISTEY